MLLQVALDKPEHLALLPQIVGDRRHRRDRHAASQALRHRRDRDRARALPGRSGAGRHQDRGWRRPRGGNGVRRRRAAHDGAVVDLAPRPMPRSTASPARLGGLVVVDTITESGKPELLPAGRVLPEELRLCRRPFADRRARRRGSLVGPYRRGRGDAPARLPGGARGRPRAADRSTRCSRSSRRSSLSGGAITGAERPREVATWIRERSAQSRAWLAVGREIAEVLERVDAHGVRARRRGVRRRDAPLVFLGPGALGAGGGDGGDALHAYGADGAFRRRGDGAVDPGGRRPRSRLWLGRNPGRRPLRPASPGRRRRKSCSSRVHPSSTLATSRGLWSFRCPLMASIKEFGGSLFEQVGPDLTRCNRTRNRRIRARRASTHASSSYEFAVRPPVEALVLNPAR